MRVRVLLAVVALGAATSLVYGTSTVAASVPAECMPDVGKDVPVVMVHGFDSNPDVWIKGNSLGSLVDGAKGFKSVIVSYESTNTKWVDHPEIGPKLAQRIACIAESSRKGGGAGKVVTIAHSMGGLAVRYAAAQTVNGRKVADDLGLMINIATPHKGAGLADFFRQALATVCTLGNPLDLDAMIRCYNQRSAVDGLGLMADGERINKLPLPPPDVPLLNIAGNDKLGIDHHLLRFEWPSLQSDLVVSVPSATMFSHEKDGVGGKVVVDCESGFVLWLDDPCAHNGLPQNEEVHAVILRTLRTYAKPPCTVDRAWLQERLNHWFEGEYIEKGLQSFAITGIACEGDWAVAGVRKKYKNREEEAGVPLEKMPEGGWMPHGNDTACPRLPQKLRPLARCK